MKNQFNLEINNPCSENFNQFTPTSDGGFCGSCQKEVIDFTKMNSEEIIGYFKNRSNQDTCGKFNSNQLKTYTENVPQRKRYSLWSKIGIACVALFSFNTIQAQVGVVNKVQGTTIQKHENDIIIKGIVSDDTGTLPGVNILLQGTTIGVETNLDGYFKFPKALKKGDILVFSFIGMESKKIIITDSNSASNIELNVNMVLEPVILVGKVGVKKVYSSKK